MNIKKNADNHLNLLSTGIINHEKNTFFYAFMFLYCS